MALLLVAFLAVLPVPVRGAEFINPPGLNVEGQQALLKERVQRMAFELVGDKLVDVMVHVGYVRTGDAAGRQVKLPGFNHFLTRTGTERGEIVAAHTRLRQILVMVDETVRSTPEALSEELRLMGQFDPSQGDLVRVIVVPAKDEKPAEMAENGKAKNGEGEDAEMAEETKELSERLRQEMEKQDKEKESEELGQMIAKASLAEAQSTTFLIRARAAFFRGDYDRTLDQILQSISKNKNNPQAYSMLGSLYYAVDWKNLALKYWEKSLTLDPGNVELQELVFSLR